MSTSDIDGKLPSRIGQIPTEIYGTRTLH